ncbi:hypothetical protein BK767_01680 [Bacillus thuringiensis serovar kyushuensis]|uniref:hypothetical protein n=1 Tax=Bacillus thuringiensis TaxID=1428 RepID=UPI000B4398C8|nr:hypothetical protein [Bacillus thuringiensis]MEC2862146.1 hypothetical protein [Bacillus cereus]OTZ74426.1 hypothetical protein BK768_13975 [Bacillus thuringiensis serovar tohokuensis]OTZ79672.1 hypothetical protein BK767_01680 [Bacillus thuringiensis serovar kyushuensis]OUB98562.1 hypothetical protein BK773_01550 [Bacillus thuringiensis serovar indiana]
MRGNKKEEQIQKIMLMQEEIKLWIQYVFQQWESKKQEQCNSFPKLAYIETVAFESSEAYQEIKRLSVELMRDMTTYKREKMLVQVTELHQHMQSIVSAVLETIQKYSVS